MQPIAFFCTVRYYQHEMPDPIVLLADVVAIRELIYLLLILWLSVDRPAFLLVSFLANFVGASLVTWILAFEAGTGAPGCGVPAEPPALPRAVLRSPPFTLTLGTRVTISTLGGTS